MRFLITFCVGVAATLAGNPTATRLDKSSRVRTRSLAGWRRRPLLRKLLPTRSCRPPLLPISKSSKQCRLVSPRCANGSTSSPSARSR